MVYVSDLDSVPGVSDFGEIYLVTIAEASSGPLRLTTSNPDDVQQNTNPFFDSTGQYVFFESARNDSYGLYQASIDGLGEVELVMDIGLTDAGPYGTQAANFGFKPTPDLLAVTFTSVLSGVYQVFTLDKISSAGNATPITGIDQNGFESYWWRP